MFTWFDLSGLHFCINIPESVQICHLFLNKYPESVQICHTLQV